MNVSVIMTVLNEGQAIRAVLESLAAQTRPPDEIVICDGGSRDDTLAIVRAYAARLPPVVMGGPAGRSPRGAGRRVGGLPLKLIELPGANIAQGRNAAIRAASGEIIAVTDAGVRCEPEWLEKLVAPLERPAASGQRPAAVAGFFKSDPHTAFEIALGATTLPEARDVNPHTYLPSSRSVAFFKTVWEKVGGYPEWLDYCEDVVFDLNVRRHFGAFHFVPEARVHFRPRASLRAFARQYYQYARGDGKANLFPRQHAIRYSAYLVVAPLLAYAAIVINSWLWLVGLLAVLAYVRLPLRRAWPRLKTLTWGERIKVLALLPVLRVVGDVAKMIGYPVGVWWRLRR